MFLIVNIIGIIIILFSLILLINPSFLIKINKLGNRIVFTDSNLFASPRLSGAGFIFFGLLIFIISAVNRYSVADVGDSTVLGIILFNIFIATGVIIFILGCIFFIKPSILVKITEIGNRVLISEETILLHPRILGIFMLLLSLYIIFMI